MEIVTKPRMSSPGTGTQHLPIRTFMSSYPSTITKSDFESSLISGEYRSSSTDISPGNTILLILLLIELIPVLPLPRFWYNVSKLGNFKSFNSSSIN